MDFQQFKTWVIQKAQAMGIEEYEIYYQGGESVSVSVFGHEVESFSASRDGGVCFRCIVGGKMGYASTEEMSPAQAEAIVERAVENASVLEAEEPVFLVEGGKTYQQLSLTPYDLPDTEALVAAALQTQEKLYKAHDHVVDGSTTEALAESRCIAICNSKGLDLKYENNVAGLVAMAVVSDGTEKVNDYQIKLGKLSHIDTDKLTQKAADTAWGKLGGEPAPTGSYPVVFDPEAVQGLLSVFSSVFSSEAAQKGLSRLGDQEGQTIASPVVTLTDDPFYEGNPMPIHFDAEGSPTYRKNIIENGVLQTLMYNLKTAAVAGKTTTGNASKAGYDAPVGLRPFTMYLAAGDLTKEQLLQKAGNGVYINSLQGLHAGASPVTGDFSLQSAGFLIEDGKLTKPVKSFTVAGNFYDLMKNIVALSDTVEVPNAFGMTAFGSPCVLVEGLSVAGKAE